MRATVTPAGEAGLLIEYGDAISRDTSRRVLAAARYIRRQGPAGIEDIVPAYTTVLVLFDRRQLSYGDLKTFVEGHRGAIDPAPESPSTRDVRMLPVAYGGSDGPDLERIASETGLAPDEVVRIHTETPYRVCFLGFTPGYPYLSGLDPRIRVPRLRTPRVRVPAGSVAIAGLQTGLYPMESPGGWSVIGRTPVSLFNPLAAEPTFLLPGDEVQFYRVPGPVAPKPLPQPDFQPHHPLCRVLMPGLYTTIQDRGRIGYMHLGVGRAGAADPHSLHRANAMLGNAPGAAALEMTALGAQVEFLADALIALAGAEAQPLVDGRPVDPRHPVAIEAGQHLSFGAFHSGLRAYLAVAGGFDAPVIMGSRSTDTVAGFGGLLGAPLKPGTVLGRATSPPPAGDGSVACADEPAQGIFRVRTVPGPQSDHFPERSRRILEEDTFIVSGDSNRMGLRLSGERTIPHNQLGPEVISEGIAPGSIQVPGDGNPIVMGSNAQTTGGYAKIGVVIRNDLARLGQAQPGDRVRFQLISRAEAETIGR